MGELHTQTFQRGNYLLLSWSVDCGWVTHPNVSKRQSAANPLSSSWLLKKQKLCCPNGNLHTKFGSLSPRKANCDRVALPVLIEFPVWCVQDVCVAPAMRSSWCDLRAWLGVESQWSNLWRHPEAIWPGLGQTWGGAQHSLLKRLWPSKQIALFRRNYLDLWCSDIYWNKNR